MLPRVPAATVRRQVRPAGAAGRRLARCRPGCPPSTGCCDGREHVALALGDRAVRAARRGSTYRSCGCTASASPATSSAALRCDCGPQLREAVARISDAGGYLLYLRQEGRGIGLYNKIDAYALQDAGLDTFEANLALGFGEDERDYAVAAQMLLALGVDRVDLLTNNPDKAAQLETAGIRVDDSVPTGGTSRPSTGATSRRRPAAATSRWSPPATSEAPSRGPPDVMRLAGPDRRLPANR